MGSGASKSSAVESPSKVSSCLSNTPIRKSSIYSAKDIKTLYKQKDIIELMSFLLGSKINSEFRLGKKAKNFISKETFFNKSYTIDIILKINEQVSCLNENLLNLGYISEKINKILQDCCQAVKKCFFKKFKVLDLVSVVNKRRVFSILRTIVELYHVCKFFKDEGVFLEDKWWGGLSESRYLSLMKRKIMKKCEAITENYEESASEDEGTPSTSDVSNNPPNKRAVLHSDSINLNRPICVLQNVNRQTNDNSGEERKASVFLSEKKEKKQIFQARKEKKQSFEARKEKKRDMAEKIEKLKNKIGLDLDHIEEMPINFECSSKRIDFNEMDFQEISADCVNGDSIKENSDEKFTTQSLKKSTSSFDRDSPKTKDSNFTVISKFLGEINEIKQCLREKIIQNPSKNGNSDKGNLSQSSASPTKKGEVISNVNDFDDSPRMIGRKNPLKNIEFFGGERPPLKSQQDYDLSHFVTNYLNKTYNNVIENSS